MSGRLMEAKLRAGSAFRDVAGGLPAIRSEGAAIDERHANPALSIGENVKLGLSMFPLFALALDLPEDFFNDKV